MSHIKKFLGGNVEFQVQGLPVSCINKLRFYHVTNIKCQNDAIFFETPLVNSKAIKNLVNNFEYQVKENYNLIRGINFLLNHFVLVVSLVIALISFLLLDMRIYSVRVQCNDADLIPSVCKHLEELGVKKFMWKNKIKSLDLANNLVGNFDYLAHAHVQISGNTLVVNLVSATNHTRKVKTNFYAQYDAVIKEITTYSGKALVTTGDVVKKGDLLVADAYPDSVVVTGEVAFVNDDQISRLVIWII